MNITIPDRLEFKIEHLAKKRGCDALDIIDDIVNVLYHFTPGQRGSLNTTYAHPVDRLIVNFLKQNGSATTVTIACEIGWKIEPTRNALHRLEHRQRVSRGQRCRGGHMWMAIMS